MSDGTDAGSSAAEGAEGNNRFCTTCGHEAVDGDRFCRRCGAPLAAPVPMSGDAPPPMPPPATVAPPLDENRWTMPSAPPNTDWGPNGYSSLPPAPPYVPRFEPDGPFAPFGVPLATWWQRVGSMLLDTLVLLIPLLIVEALTGTLHTASTATGAGTTHSVNIFGGPFSGRAVSGLVTIVYFGLMNGLGRGQTVGNRALGIAVRDLTSGEVIGLWRGLLRAAVRAVLYLALIVPGIVNDLFPLWDRRRQSLADKVARTVVIRTK